MGKWIFELEKNLFYLSPCRQKQGFAGRLKYLLRCPDFGRYWTKLKMPSKIKPHLHKQNPFEKLVLTAFAGKINKGPANNIGRKFDLKFFIKYISHSLAGDK